MPEKDDLIRNPKFWAVWAGIWLGLLLALGNIYSKAVLLTQLAR